MTTHHHESAVRGPDARMADRLLFFSDAVFAIVLTVMVLELQPPALTGPVGSDAALWDSVYAIRHQIAAFVISFVLVGLWWTIHLRATRRLIIFDWPVAILNLLFLFTIAAMPFACAVFGSAFESPAAMEIYWAVNAAASFAMTLLFVVMARGGGRLMGGIGAGEWAFRFIQSIAPGIAFSVGVWLAANGYFMYSHFCWVLILPVMMLARLIPRPKT